jgi:predicted  nucleic acid-binding Zn-ribbon protein
MFLRSRYVVFIAFLLVMSISGCQTAYYATWEKLGKEKRHLLRDNVQKAQQEQQQASEEFKDVLTRIKEIYGFDGGDLEKAYDKLKSGYDDCEDRANAVRKRIGNVEQIAADLFKEWEQEIDEMNNAELREKSIDALGKTKKRYARLHDAMSSAESRMDPVLQQVRDYVLYLKHNLNAQAIGALEEEVDDIEIEVEALIREMQTSIQEAETFLEEFE